MAKFEVIFFPSAGEQGSPADYLISLEDSDKALVQQKLDVISERLPHDWPGNWVHKVEEFLQLTQGNHRFLLITDRNQEKSFIVILHAFMKKTNKTPRKELVRARSHHKRYLDGKKES